MEVALIPTPSPAPSPLRILFVVDGRFPATGGAEMQARMLAAALMRGGHRISVLAPRIGGEHAVRESLDGVPVRRLGYPRIKGLGAILLNLRYAAWLLRHQREFDAIHIHMMHNLAGAAGWLKPWLKPRLAVKVSGAAEFHGGLLDPGLQGRLKHRLLNFGAKRIDIFQCISQHTLMMLRNAGYPADRLHLIPNAVDAGRFELAQAGRDGPVQVVFAGRHVPVKALDVLLRAWALVRAPQGSQLVLAGDGPEHAALVALAHELGIESRVRFPGMVRDIPALLRDAQLYVQASHQEGLPNSVLEAMASALPVVATRVSGHEDVVCDGSTGLLVPPADPRALAQAMQTLVDSPALRQRMGKVGREAVLAGYSLDRVLERLLRLYGGQQV
jgi:glycosyltransferase involved in cell wall biosynthesis